MKRKDFLNAFQRIQEKGGNIEITIELEGGVFLGVSPQKLWTFLTNNTVFYFTAKAFKEIEIEIYYKDIAEKEEELKKIKFNAVKIEIFNRNLIQITITEYDDGFFLHYPTPQKVVGILKQILKLL